MAALSLIGGGLPVGAFGGKREIMEYIAPIGPVYQAGTLSGNPISMSAGLAMLNILSEDKDFFNKLNNNAQKLVNGILSKANDNGIDMTANVVGGMFGLFFTEESNVTNFEQASNCNLERFKSFYHLMLNEGVYLAPSAYEAGFISSKHTDIEIQFTIDAAGKALSRL